MLSKKDMKVVLTMVLEEARAAGIDSERTNELWNRVLDDLCDYYSNNWHKLSLKEIQQKILEKKEV